MASNSQYAEERRSVSRRGIPASPSPEYVEERIEPDPPRARRGSSYHRHNQDDFEAFRKQLKRSRSPTPPWDDYPVPDIDDMRVSPRWNTYTTKRTKRKTHTTPTQYELDRLEFLRRRDERRERDDWDMYTGLRDFKGTQRGWDGRYESDRRLAEKQRREEGKQRQHEARNQTNKLQRSPRRHTTAKELEDGFEDHQSAYAIAAIGLEDQIRYEEDRNHREMMKARWDVDAIRQSALEEQRREQEHTRRPRWEDNDTGEKEHRRRQRWEDYDTGEKECTRRPRWEDYETSDMMQDIAPSTKPPPKIRLRFNKKSAEPASPSRNRRRSDADEGNCEAQLPSFDHPANPLRATCTLRQVSEEAVVKCEPDENGEYEM